MTLRQLRFYANLITTHQRVRYRQLSRRSGRLVALWGMIVGVGDDVMLLLLRG